MNKIFQEHFLDIPVFRLVAILKSANKIFEKQPQRNPFKLDDSESISKIFEKDQQKTCILENFSVSMNKIFEIHL